MDADLRRRERQIDNELNSVQRGVERYRMAQSQREFPDTAGGQSVLRSIMGDCVEEIAKMQAEYGVLFVNTELHRRPPSGAYAYLLAVSADALALIALRVLLSSLERTSSDKANRKRAATHVANRIATRVLAEIEYQRWREEKRSEAKEREDGWDAGAWLASVADKVDYDAWLRWKRKRKDIVSLRGDLSPADMIRLGDALLTALSRTRWFNIETEFTAKDKKRRIVTLHPDIMSISDATDARMELLRPYYGPMLCPPNDWRRT